MDMMPDLVVGKTPTLRAMVGPTSQQWAHLSVETENNEDTQYSNSSKVKL